MRRVDPPKLVEVRVDDTWHPGQLGAWRREGGGWLAYVRYCVGVGLQHLDWLPSDDVRPVLPSMTVSS